MSFLCCRVPRSRSPDQMILESRAILPASSQQGRSEYLSSLDSECSEDVHDTNLQRVFAPAEASNHLSRAPNPPWLNQVPEDSFSSVDLKNGNGLRKRISQRLSKASSLSRPSSIMRLSRSVVAAAQGYKQELRRPLHQHSRIEFHNNEDSLYDADAISLMVPPSAGSTWLRQSMQPSENASGFEAEAFQSEAEVIQNKMPRRESDKSYLDSQREAIALHKFNFLASGQTLIEDISRTLGTFGFDKSYYSKNEDLILSPDSESQKIKSHSESTGSNSTNLDPQRPFNRILSDASTASMIPPPPILKPLHLPSITPSTTASIWRLSQSHPNPANVSLTTDELSSGRALGATQHPSISSNRSRILNYKYLAPVRRGNSITSWSPGKSKARSFDYGDVEDVFTEKPTSHQGRTSLQSTIVSSESTSSGGPPRLHEMHIPERLAPSEFQSSISLPLQKKTDNHTRHLSGASLPSTLPWNGQSPRHNGSFSDSIMPKWCGDIS